MSDRVPNPARKVAVIVVPGVGDHPAGEAVTQVATGLTTDAGYAWAEPTDECEQDRPLVIEVPSERARRGERYEAEIRRLVRDDGVPVNLLEMRWSDLSSFPRSGLRAFFASAFGLGLQIATAGLEATPPEDRRRAGRGWTVAAAIIVVLAAVLLAASVAGDPQGWWFAAAGGLAGLLLLVVLWRASAGFTSRFANGLMEAASWWAAAIIVPMTLIAALAGTALWLAVDEPLGISDWMGAASVTVAGWFAVGALGKGIADGGWRYADGRWRGLLDPRRLTRLLFVAALGVGVWRGIRAGSVEGGLGQTVLLVGGYGVRPAWLVGVVLVALALVAIVLSHVLRGELRLGRAAFTGLATTVLSPLLVAVLGTILVGGIGAVAFTSADDATWGRPAPELRCLDGSADWSWSPECGTSPDTWQGTATAIGARLDQADGRDRDAAVLRARGIGDAGPTQDDLRLAEEAERDAERLRAAAARIEDDAGTAPTTWATEVFDDVMLPLVPIVLLLALVVIGAGLWLLLAVPLARRWTRPRGANPPGTRLDLVLSGVTGPAGTWGLSILGALACALTVVFWTRVDPRDPPEMLSGPDWLPAPGPEIWAAASALILAGLGLARVLPVDPRKPTADIGGALTKLRGILDIVYDVATYLRIDSGGDGVRSRVVARYRALLAAVDAGGYTHLVVVAHSQGSMYSVATLFGDPRRREPEALGGEGIRRWAEVAPGSRLTRLPVGLLTFGCPIRQTYEERLPGQYRWIDLAGDDDRRRLATFSGPWVNIYRPRDYIGRAVFHPSGDPRSNRQLRGRRRTVARPSPAAAVDVIDVCISGTGTHTGYFGDPQVAVWLRFTLGRLLDPWPTRPPDPYVIEGPATAAP